MAGNFPVFFVYVSFRVCRKKEKNANAKRRKEKIPPMSKEVKSTKNSMWANFEHGRTD